MSTRGVHHRHVATITTQFRGAFDSDADLRRRFLDLGRASAAVSLDTATWLSVGPFE